MVVVYSVLYSVPDETSSIVVHTQIIAEREKDVSYLITSSNGWFMGRTAIRLWCTVTHTQFHSQQTSPLFQPPSS
jgi:hypothetical protein